jgi:Fur family ferric uptake transcriptional regulator
MGRNYAASVTTSAPKRRPPAADREEALRRLREEGGRVTAAKEAMVELFFAEPGSLTADEVRARMAAVDESTVYRGLAQLEQAGIVEHVHPGHGPATYRLAGASTVAVVCSVCERVIDVDRADLDDLVGRVRRRYGVELDLHHFALSGRCPDCLSTAR